MHATHPHLRTPMPAPRLDELRPGERGRLLGWLDQGLRGGRSGRVAAEYPIALAEARPAHHVLARTPAPGCEPASHALARSVEVDVCGTRVPVGMIGLVYTSPEFRGRGLASACIREATERLARRGAALALLWSDRPAFYQRLGFAPVGREVFHRVDTRICRRLQPSDADRDPVAMASSHDFPGIESLYAAKPVHVERSKGWAALATTIPDCTIVVARRAGHPVAYAALGRGDDFPGVVHEWAGDARGVAACLGALVGAHGPLLVLAGACEEPLGEALRLAGAPREERPLALGCALEGPAVSRRVAASARASLDALFLWGFDSI